ncbi:MAG: ABC transporter ATP-binding protein [Flexistipes sinusarabici]|uniref:ABC transporter ATP-binding protein n=1 Tax=Flexistipes sinusarabici TaxID=2352 RepID=A0A5D0MXY3_FLESI|nr:ABC transporter ATP-binding protein [Flexistipes sinusarabici]TYB37003.1 MAG: ABC transporter ATP-binding protein [Flexistipes sinusarabici]
MLQIKNTGINFGGVKALDNVNFDVPYGRITALIGPNGAGKTTLFNIITGFLKSNTGEIFFENENITNAQPYQIFTKGISRTFQNLNLISELSLKENLLLGIIGKDNPSAVKSILRLNGKYWKRVEKKIDYCMEITGISEWCDKKTDEVPYGILKYLEIARAIINEPKTLLLDEPAAGLNNVEKENLMELIKFLISKNMTIFMVEHDMNFVSNLADNVICLNYGKVIANGSYRDIRNNEEVIKAYLGDSDA